MQLVSKQTVSGAVVTPILYTPASSPKGQVPTPAKGLNLGDKSPEKSDDTSKPADDALASDPDSSKGKAQGSQEVPEIAVEDSDERSVIEDSQPSGPLDVEGSGVGASSDVEVRAQTKSPKAISSKVLCMKKEDSSIDLEEEDTGRNERSPASITFKALETTDWKSHRRLPRAKCLPSSPSLRIPRWFGLGGNTQGVKLHGFGDDSEDASAAAVYMGIPTDDGVSVRLLASKTKLAPMRKMSIPRLELCAALLLTRLSWLRTMSGNLPTFIGNRVAEIQSCTQVREWRYVPTGDNPADIASRGILGSELKQSSIWWTGPTWLSAESTEWPRKLPVFENHSQTELLNVHAISETPFLVAIGEISSTFNGYIRKVAWILRYCHNCRYIAERYQSHLTTAELRNAHRRILQAIQYQHFREAIRSLTTLGSVKCTGKICGLAPFLDDQGIIGVGGGLKWAPSMTYEQKHPALLPSSGEVAQMIIQAVHMRTLHGSVHLMLSTLRQKYWMLRAKDQVKRCIRECVTFCRYNRVTQGQLMSDLPKERLTPGKPFSISGVDYAGPVNLRLSKDASTPTIMSAFKRFVARRGHCTRLCGDQGTSFVGASRQLRSRFYLAQNQLKELAAVIFKTNALVVDKVTSYMPYLKYEEHQFDHLQGLQLADPQYQYTAPIDILLGADIAFSLFKGAIKYGNEGQPKAIKTLLGWLLFGEIKTFQKKSRNYQKLHTFNCTLNNWEPIFSLWEEELKTKHDPFEDDFNEIHFKTTHERETSGRYIVRLPFKDPSLLGESKPQAFNCFLRMEQILKQHPQVYQTYKDFMQEYLVLGHMNEVKGNGNDHKAFYLPHHPIIKEKSSTTKLRVVFNASSKTTTGYSLNDILHTGPKIQKDIFPLLFRFRSHPIAISADITKMYRQILVHPEDTPYQRIIWRDESGQGLKEYELKTLTYGTSCAPFLAIRVLKQLAHDEQIRFPTAEAILKSDFYVDDLLTGCETVENGRKLIRELDQLLQAGETDKSTFYANVDRENTLGINLLGIYWNPRNDEIGLRKLEIIKNAPTKRNILYQMAKIYDPLGWFAPVMLKIKLIIQTLWAAKLTWDEPIPVRLQESWKALQNDLASLHQVQIPRWIGLFEPATYEIHGFADASQRAYAAMVYIKIIHISSIHEVTLWSDSTIVLSWLASEHNRWKPYVSNRVKDIQELLPCRWMHVKGEDNPADLASRGISLDQLLDLELWWHGPPWLKTTSQPYNDAIPVINEKCLNEQRIKTNLFVKKNISYPFITRYSSLNKLKRITGWIFRFFYNCRKLLKREKSGALSIEEIKTSFNRIIRCAQQEDNYIDLKQLEAFQPLSGKSPLIKLNPFLDKEAFLAALRRFIGRRGRPAEINTDNATNFVGAYKDLRKLFNSNIHDFASSEEIKWNFMPPSSPHFGGLWEAGIKSVKYHLRRIVGKTKLTFEELTTALTQIEACLNSRPLCPPTDDPEDLNALTAGHFLIGMPLTAVPSLVREGGSSLKGRWQLVEQIKTDFWKRWSCEYFSRLQNRPKWLKPVDNIKIGTLVLLKEDNLPPLKWRMGRINQVYPGEDGLVRVVSVKTADGDLRRAVAKVCPLPLDCPTS
ncbi:hypothetical protein LAZ67_1006982 [Cordylochernes scorpioides]|uniref:Integrase catalytic domain-containing protein n=1 Tax=Cordylochernes scorpioides TaxID=51811 RepID=A0ABY6JZD2_9ARAC|nr:hypothetical protein LAZ67_1006982 [Cordylochernes scorpioides]